MKLLFSFSLCSEVGRTGVRVRKRRLALSGMHFREGMCWGGKLATTGTRRNMALPRDRCVIITAPATANVSPVLCMSKVSFLITKLFYTIRSRNPYRTDFSNKLFPEVYPAESLLRPTRPVIGRVIVTKPAEANRSQVFKTLKEVVNLLTTRYAIGFRKLTALSNKPGAEVYSRGSALKSSDI